jgi:pectinesterase
MTVHRVSGAILKALLILLILPGCAQARDAQTRDIYIVGDSTASEYGPEVFPRMGWGQVLDHFYGNEIEVHNLAQSGRSAKSYIAEGFFAGLEQQLGSGDILLIQFGHNDQKADSPERYAPAQTEYKELLGQYISLAREKGAVPVLLTSVVRRKFENGQLVPTHGDYPAAMIELAVESDVHLIDMNQLSRQFITALGEQDSKAIYLQTNGPEGLVEDNTHFSERGAYAMAAMVARELDHLKLLALQPADYHFLRVEKDGRGDTETIQAALNQLDAHARPAVVLIGAGDFNEKLFITRDDITLVGLGNDRTTISTSELRANWRVSHTDDWGAATVNIKASDITVLKLRVLNDYGIRYGDHSHQFAVRLMEGSRIITEDSSFIAGGADTVSLWNTKDGLYYHRRDYFEGHTDFVCPRGWNYITDSTFFSRGGAAAIWHDGSVHESQKMVVRNSRFDGVENFILGRRQYDAQFWLINNHYSRNMADTPIFRVHYPEGDERNRPNLWGDRYYFHGSVMDGEPYSWLTDNIPADVADITPLETFEGRWDPEAKLVQLKAQIALHEVSLSANGDGEASGVAGASAARE